MFIKKYLRKLRLFNKFAITKKIYGTVCANPINMSSAPGNNFLVIAPHPDDELLGCAGLMQILKSQQKNVYVFFSNHTTNGRKIEAQKVSETLEIPYFFIETNFKNEVKEILEKYQITTILLPHLLDNHPQHFSTVKELYILCKNSFFKDYKFLMYEVWTPLIPNIVIDISAYFDRKIELLKIYESQLQTKDYISVICGLNAYRAALLEKKAEYAECFTLLHSVKEFIELFEYCLEL